MNRPHDVAGLVRDLETVLPNADCLLVVLHREVIGGAPGVRGDDGMHVATDPFASRARELPSLVDAGLPCLDVPATEIQQAEPDEEPWDKCALTRSEER